MVWQKFRISRNVYPVKLYQLHGVNWKLDMQLRPCNLIRNLWKYFSEKLIKCKKSIAIRKFWLDLLWLHFFYEPSTRTRLSFEAAMMKLGGQVISTEQAANFSSAAKGETLQDTIRTVEGYSDLIVIRHPESGSAKAAAEVAAVPIISAGDGPGEHPTQALLDLYTIRQEIGSLDEKFSIAMIGDLQNGRTVHSLAYLLSQYPNIDMYFVSPKEVKLPQKILSFLEEEGVRCIETENLQDVAKTCRVLYNTRIQKERFQNQEVYERVNGSYIIDKNLLNDMMENAVILHPLPRNTEITPEVDSDCRAAYFRQARNGLFIRMALLKLALLGADNCEFD
eukprot:TRINITY_DN16824_c0_g1_i1.p1 TRINITY_DN16824_c0_g1~~TRINITY_DN16824_c0_g1_i1.p1  ORF type:complete len:337 (+),score=41.97 TRINITY_DN16824_c0_g1_i1:320-1330(+)